MTAAVRSALSCVGRALRSRSLNKVWRSVVSGSGAPPVGNAMLLPSRVICDAYLLGEAYVDVELRFWLVPWPPLTGRA